MNPSHKIIYLPENLEKGIYILRLRSLDGVELQVKRLVKI
jgi:hypothetical protein